MVTEASKAENLPVGVMRSLRISRLIKGLSDEEIRSVLALYRERGGFTAGGLGAGVTPREDLQIQIGAWDMQGVDAERYLHSLISEVRG